MRDLNPECDDCRREQRTRAQAVRAAAKIITPGAWWSGKPPNKFQQQRVNLAMKKARGVFAVFAASKQTS